VLKNGEQSDTKIPQQQQHFPLNHLAVPECGHVTGIQEGNSLRLTFYPSYFFNTQINDSAAWRWLFYPRFGGPLVLTERYNGILNTTKYQGRGNLLVIKYITERDNGKYDVDCWTNRNTYRIVPWVFVYKPELTTTAGVATTHALDTATITQNIIVGATKVDETASGTSSKDSSTGFDAVTVISAVVAGLIIMVIVVGAAILTRRRSKLLLDTNY